MFLPYPTIPTNGCPTPGGHAVRLQAGCPAAAGIQPFQRSACHHPAHHRLPLRRLVNHEVLPLCSCCSFFPLPFFFSSLLFRMMFSFNSLLFTSVRRTTRGAASSAPQTLSPSYIGVPTPNGGLTPNNNGSLIDYSLPKAYTHASTSQKNVTTAPYVTTALQSPQLSNTMTPPRPPLLHRRVVTVRKGPAGFGFHLAGAPKNGAADM